MKNWCTHHSQEDVGGGVDALAGGGADGDLQEPTDFDDDPLHDAVVVEQRHEKTEEKGHRQNLEGVKDSNY